MHAAFWKISLNINKFCVSGYDASSYYRTQKIHCRDCRGLWFLPNDLLQCDLLWYCLTYLHHGLHPLLKLLQILRKVTCNRSDSAPAWFLLKVNVVGVSLGYLHFRQILDWVCISSQQWHPPYFQPPLPSIFWAVLLQLCLGKKQDVFDKHLLPHGTESQLPLKDYHISPLSYRSMDGNVCFFQAASGRKDSIQPRSLCVLRPADPPHRPRSHQQSNFLLLGLQMQL